MSDDRKPPAFNERNQRAEEPSGMPTMGYQAPDNVSGIIAAMTDQGGGFRSRRNSNGSADPPGAANASNSIMGRNTTGSGDATLPESAVQQQVDMQLQRMRFLSATSSAAGNFLQATSTPEQQLEAFLRMQQQQQMNTVMNFNPFLAGLGQQQQLLMALSQQQDSANTNNLFEQNLANMRNTSDLAAMLRYTQFMGQGQQNPNNMNSNANNNGTSNPLLAAHLSAAAAAATGSNHPAAVLPASTWRAPPADPNKPKPLMLGIDQDQNWLSELQCFVRSEILEVVQASQRDVDIRNTSKSVQLNQVGVRCRWCAHLQPGTRATRSSAYPSSIRQIYQSFTMMLRDHIEKCPQIPPPLLVHYRQLKNQGQQGACDSKNYWIYSAKKLGMVDKEGGGIEITDESKEAAAEMPSFRTEELDKATTDDNSGEGIPLVTPEDKANLTPFLYTLLTHVQLIRLLECEKLGKRRGLPVGLEGLGCKYCSEAGRLGFSRNFPLRRKTLSARVLEVYYHLRRCALCPNEVKKELATLHGESQRGVDVEKERVFYDMLWSRLNRTEDITI